MVINVDPILFPINPSLSPLTNLGIIKAIPTDDGDKIVIIASGSAYLFDAVKNPAIFPTVEQDIDLSLFSNFIDFKDIEVTFSPDQNKQLFLQLIQNLIYYHLIRTI